MKEGHGCFTVRFDQPRQTACIRLVFLPVIADIFFKAILNLYCQYFICKNIDSYMCLFVRPVNWASQFELRFLIILGIFEFHWIFHDHHLAFSSYKLSISRRRATLLHSTRALRTQWWNIQDGLGFKNIVFFCCFLVKNAGHDACCVFVKLIPQYRPSLVIFQMNN